MFWVLVSSGKKINQKNAFIIIVITFKSALLNCLVALSVGDLVQSIIIDIFVKRTCSVNFKSPPVICSKVEVCKVNGDPVPCT